MKILYHHRTASNDGQAVHIEEMILSLRDLGHEIQIVSPRTQTNNSMGNKIGWVHNLKGLLPHFIYEVMELCYNFLEYYRLTIAIKDFEPDVLYVRYNLYMIAGVIIRRQYNIPLILEVNSPLAEERYQHGGLSLPRMAAWFESKVWKSADIVLPVTKVLADYILNKGVSSRKIMVMPNGINLSKFSNLYSTEESKKRLGLQGKLVLGFTGFVRGWHGMDKVIRWMAQNTDYNAHLLIVGDGPVRKELELLSQTLGIYSNITFTGVISRENVPEYVAAFDIALQPAVVYYASPLKLFEYMALSKAIIAPDTPNLREILEDGKNALLFPIEQDNSFESLLGVLCTNALIRTRLGLAARQTIINRDLTWLGNARKIESLCKQLLAFKV